MALNPHCRVEIYALRLEAANIREVMRGYDLVLDASDNFPTRFLVADCCWLERIPLVSAAVAAFQGLLLVVDPGRGSPCYRCLVCEPPGISPAEGILGAVAGVMGCLQAVETVKLLLGRSTNLAHECLSYDGLKCRFHTLKRTRAPQCPLCGENPSITGLTHHPPAAGDEAGSNPEAADPKDGSN